MAGQGGGSSRVALVVATMLSIAAAGLSVACTQAFVAPAALAPTAQARATLDGPLHVAGARLHDASGAVMLLRGAQIPGYNVAAAYTSQSAFTPAAFSAMRAWHMNELRLPFSGCLITKAPTYLAGLAAHVHAAEAAGLYVVLAMFDDSRAGCHPGGVNLPQSYSLTQWRAVASVFAGDRDVLFDLYNEPKVPSGTPADTAWSAWLNGGTVMSPSGVRVQVVGMNQLAMTIRAAGAADQPLIAEPWNGVPVSEVFNHELSDRNVMYSVHTYFAGATTPASWTALFGNATTTVAVFVGEWAFLPNATDPRQCARLHLTTAQATSMVKQFLTYMDSRGVSYNAWAFIPTRLIVDDVHFTPTTLPDPLRCDPGLQAAGMGALYRAHLLAAASA